LPILLRKALDLSVDIEIAPIPRQHSGASSSNITRGAHWFGRHAIYSATDLSRSHSVLSSSLMSIMRQFVRLRSRGGLLAVFVAYSLTIQTMMGSVGLGMSAGTSPDWAGLILCSFASHQTAEPTRDGGRQKPRPAPQCPFCFVAAQSAGHIATIGEAATFPAYAGLVSDAILDSVGAKAFVFQLHHKNGEPRAPPAFSL
jgi:hypothetical protein